MMSFKKKRMLLHCCCAPCGTHPIRLLQKNFNVVPYFYNPNIHPKDEYEMRRNEMKTLMDRWHFSLIEDIYDINHWFERIKGYENEPEGGERCALCYRIRLKRTALYARENGFDYFATTLSISPHKKAAMINVIGKELEKKYNVQYYEADFKKKNGFKISCQISKEEGLYRQRYCGCIFSQKEFKKKEMRRD
jgi:predicted adenine nucleotide alpha hydrolase (AANH) superfamily ATPase